MINVSELRIGNWVETYTVLLSGSWIDKDGNRHGQDVFTEPTIRQKQIDIEDLKIIASSTLATYRPIPLTPDILINNCGFAKVKLDYETENVWGYKYDKYSVWMDGDFIVEFEDGKDGVIIARKIFNLHQLQNLYYSLTQTELNINL